VLEVSVMLSVLSLANIFYLPKLVVSELLAFSDPDIVLPCLCCHRFYLPN